LKAVKHPHELRFALLLILASFIFLNIRSFGYGQLSYVTVYPGVYFRHSNSGGYINFTQTIRLNGCTWSGGFVQIQGLYFGGFTENSVGFACSGNGNMTIREISSDRLSYVVNAPTFATSTTRIYLPGRPRPNAVMGATIWTHSDITDVLTVQVLHSSPAYVNVTWGGTLSSRVPNLSAALTTSSDLLGVMLVTLAGVSIILILKGAEPEALILFVVVMILNVAILVILLGQFMQVMSV